MHRGADLLGGRTNSAEGIIGPTREFCGYNYSLAPYTDLSLPVSTGRKWETSSFQKVRHRRVSGDTQTVDFEGTG